MYHTVLRVVSAFCRLSETLHAICPMGQRISKAVPPGSAPVPVSTGHPSCGPPAIVAPVVAPASTESAPAVKPVVSAAHPRGTISEVDAINAASRLLAPLRSTVDAGGDSCAVTAAPRLRELAVAISATLDAVVANAAAAREQVDGLLIAAHVALTRDHDSAEAADALDPSAALDRAASELRAEISAAKSRKTVALEAEAVRVDEALVLVADVLEGRGDQAALEECLRSLPTSPVEHPGIEVVEADDPSECTSALLPFRVRVLPTPGAAEVLLRPVARSVRASPRAVLCHLSLSSTITAGMHPTDVDALLTSLRPRISATAALVAAQGSADVVSGSRICSNGVAAMASSLSVSFTTHSRGILAVSVDLPGDSRVGSWVVLSRITIGDQPLAFVGRDDPSSTGSLSSIAFLVCRGLVAPHVFDAPSGQVYKTPAVSDTAVLFMPDGGHVVEVLETDVASSLQPRRFELPADLHAFGAAFDARTGRLLLGSADGRIAAVDSATGSVCWVSSRDAGSSACGIAVMPEEGICIIAAGLRLVVFHISDGSLAAEVQCSDGEYRIRL